MYRCFQDEPEQQGEHWENGERLDHPFGFAEGSRVPAARAWAAAVFRTAMEQEELQADSLPSRYTACSENRRAFQADPKVFPPHLDHIVAASAANQAEVRKAMDHKQAVSRMAGYRTAGCRTAGYTSVDHTQVAYTRAVA